MMSSPEEILKELLTAAGLPYTSIEKSEAAGQDILSVKTDDAKMLIGMRGETVQALDHIVKKIHEHRNPTSRADSEASPSDGTRADSRRSEGASMFLVDVNEYRSKQIHDLQAKALMMAERARSFQYDVELSPMSSYERLIVHTALAEEPHVKTESQGEGRSRRVVIKYSAE